LGCRPATSAAGTTQAIGIGRQLRVLAAENNKTNRLVLRRMSKKLNIALRFFTDGSQTVEVCATFQADLILMDISIRGLDGKEATNLIRKGEAEAGHHVPIVALKVHPNPGDNASVLDSGWECYIIKFLRKTLLLKYLREHCPVGAATP
jgi:CheY-like chemotaxis protein